MRDVTNFRPVLEELARQGAFKFSVVDNFSEHDNLDALIDYRYSYHTAKASLVLTFIIAFVIWALMLSGVLFLTIVKRASEPFLGLLLLWIIAALFSAIVVYFVWNAVLHYKTTQSLEVYFVPDLSLNNFVEFSSGLIDFVVLDLDTPSTETSQGIFVLTRNKCKPELVSLAGLKEMEFYEEE